MPIADDGDDNDDDYQPKKKKNSNKKIKLLRLWDAYTHMISEPQI